MEKIDKYIKANMADNQSIDSLIIYKNGSGYEVNKKTDIVFDVRSVAKTILSLACGILIDQNPSEFNLDTRIYPIIKDKVNLTNKKNLNRLEKVRVRDILTHTTGFRDLVFSSRSLKESDKEKLLDHIINYPIYYEPGTHFLYSNAGCYLLSVTMQEYLSYPLFDFIEENLFKPLGIFDRSWSKYGDYLAGATNVFLNADDMLKLGKLILNEGKYDGKRIVSASYIDQMIKPSFENLNETKRDYLSEDHYGLGMWISKSGVIFASGTGGQLIVILKDLNIVIVTTNNGSDSKSYKIKADVDELIKILYEYRS